MKIFQGIEPIDYKTKSFNLREAKYYLYNILKNSREKNIKK